MTSTISDTSYWIRFFTSAGIPAGDATHYAIIFTDNRIGKEMLLDLTKEYLTDMGISRLGDVIAILKHCKSVYNQEARDKVMKTASFHTPPSFSTRRSTAASRMVNHFTSRDPEASPMTAPPVPKLPPPDPPQGKRKVSVFDRLGEDGEDDSAAASPAAASSVFSRLGGQSGQAAAKRSAATFSLETESWGDNVPKKDSGVLPYAGVLKNDSPSPIKKKRISLTTTKDSFLTRIPDESLRIKKVIKNTLAEEKVPSSKEQKIQLREQKVVLKEKKIPSVQRPEVSSTGTAGVLSDQAREAPSLRDRLGTKAAAAAAKSDISSAATVVSSIDSTTAAAGVKARPKINKPDTSFKMTIQNRLGSKSDDVSSSPVVSSSQPSVQRKQKDVAMKEDSSKKSGVFSRLGKKS